MSTVNAVSPYNPYQYGYPPQQYPPYNPVAPGYGTPYTPDAYQMPGAYNQGYVQGATATSGMSSGISSIANSFGGIFNTVTSVIASVLNTIVTVIVNIFKGIFNFFKNLLGFGNKPQQQQTGSAQGPQAPYPMMQQGQNTAGVPTPPPGTDLKTAFDIVSGDVGNINNPNQGIQVVSLHAQKSRDNRNAAEQAASQAKKDAEAAAALADELSRKRAGLQPAELQKMLNDIEYKKTKSMESLKMAEELTKAVYDEALYAKMANDILFAPTGKFPQYGNSTAQAVADGWSNWTSGYNEKKWLFFNNRIAPAPEVFMEAVNAVNGQLSRANYILGSIR